MRNPFQRLILALTAVCLPLLLSGRLLAAPAPAGALLGQAYVTLAHADHDYKGHRAAAMKHIEAAGKALGVNVRGDGRGHEVQRVSDEQLRVAKSMLEQARTTLSGRPLKHVNKALRELSVALKIK